MAEPTDLEKRVAELEAELAARHRADADAARHDRAMLAVLACVVAALGGLYAYDKLTWFFGGVRPEVRRQLDQLAAALDSVEADSDGFDRLPPDLQRAKRDEIRAALEPVYAEVAAVVPQTRAERDERQAVLGRLTALRQRVPVYLRFNPAKDR